MGVWFYENYTTIGCALVGEPAMVKTTAAGAVGDDDSLSEADRRALRGSRFASLPPPSHFRPKPLRLAHPGGPVATNKAAALAKFLERKLQEPGGLDSINPDHLERAVVNAKETLRASNNGGASTSRTVRHVTSFGDSSEENGQNEEDNKEISEESMRNHKKRQKKKSEEEIDHQSLKKKKKMKNEIKKKKKRKQHKKKRQEKTS